MRSLPPSPKEMREACEQYPRRWHRNNGISAEAWQKILDLLYAGHQVTHIARTLGLSDSCLSSLRAHRAKHIDYITKRQGRRFIESRIAGAPTFAEVYEEARQEMMKVLLDPGLTPTKRAMLFRAFFLEAKELRKLIENQDEKTAADYERMSRVANEAAIGTGAMDLAAALRRIHDVYNIRPSGPGDG